VNREVKRGKPYGPPADRVDPGRLGKISPEGPATLSIEFAIRMKDEKNDIKKGPSKFEGP
jgi:hypothetical protein